MVDIKGTSIVMTAGDTLSANLNITNYDGTPYEVQQGDVIIFGMRLPTDTECIVEKRVSNSTLEVRLESDDTNDLPPDKYLYDIEITFADGTVYTLINRGVIVLKEQVVDHA